MQPEGPFKPEYYKYWTMTNRNDLIRVLDLEAIEQNHYRATSPSEGWQRVYGGQVLGQVRAGRLGSTGGSHSHPPVMRGYHAHAST